MPVPVPLVPTIAAERVGGQELGAPREALFDAHQQPRVAGPADRRVEEDVPVRADGVHIVALRVRALRNHRPAGAVPAVVVDAVDERVDEALPDDIGADDEAARELALHTETERESRKGSR